MYCESFFYFPSSLFPSHPSFHLPLSPPVSLLSHLPPYLIPPLTIFHLPILPPLLPPCPSSPLTSPSLPSYLPAPPPLLPPCPSSPLTSPSLLPSYLPILPPLLPPRPSSPLTSPSFLPSYLPVPPPLLPPRPSPLTSPPLLPSYLPTPALAEARDISMHLNPLRKHFEAMEEMEYLELPKHFPAVLHLICLVWSHSTHYQQPARIIVLLQEIANLLILLVRWLTSELGL